MDNLEKDIVIETRAQVEAGEMITHEYYKVGKLTPYRVDKTLNVDPKFSFGAIVSDLRGK